MTLDIQPLLIASSVGFLSGTHTAIWGMYKDAIHEGFALRRFARSMIVGSISAVVLQAMLHLALPSPAAIVLLFGLAYGTERAIVEVWKTFIRDEDQAKYFIPMQFSLRGVPVTSRRARFAFGLGYVAVVALCLLGVARLDDSAGLESRTLYTAWVGLVVGAIVALGGGWKDAPKEGFSPIKFLRSPTLTVLFAFLLSRLTGNFLLIGIAAIGYERATAETYKTFFFPSRPRGKFSGKPILHPAMLEHRKDFVPTYVAISIAVAVCVTLAVRS